MGFTPRCHPLALLQPGIQQSRGALQLLEGRPEVAVAANFQIPHRAIVEPNDVDGKDGVLLFIVWVGFGRLRCGEDCEATGGDHRGACKK